MEHNLLTLQRQMLDNPEDDELRENFFSLVATWSFLEDCLMADEELTD